MLDINFEQEFFTQTGKLIVGIDEVGRGAWAGPLVLGASIVHNPIEYHLIKDVRDSKRITKSSRERIFTEIDSQVENNHVSVLLSVIEAITISKIGLSASIHMAISDITQQLLLNFPREKIHLVFDGGLKSEEDISQESIVKGDDKIYSIALSSLYSKVFRDSIMAEIHSEYPEYDFAKNVGYGTKSHRLALSDYGAIPNVHRFSYKPIQKIVAIKGQMS